MKTTSRRRFLGISLAAGASFKSAAAQEPVSGKSTLLRGKPAKPALLSGKPLRTDPFPFIRNTLHSRGFSAIYAKERIAWWEERNQCPQNDKLCEEAVWFTQTMLLGTRRDMEQIAEAVRKIQAHAEDLARL